MWMSYVVCFYYVNSMALCNMQCVMKCNAIRLSCVRAWVCLLALFQCTFHMHDFKSISNIYIALQLHSSPPNANPFSALYCRKLIVIVSNLHLNLFNHSPIFNSIFIIYFNAIYDDIEMNTTKKFKEWEKKMDNNTYVDNTTKELSI